MNTENVVPHLREEAVNPVGDLLEGGVTTGIKRTAIHGSYKDLRQLSAASHNADLICGFPFVVRVLFRFPALS